MVHELAVSLHDETLPSLVLWEHLVLVPVQGRHAVQGTAAGVFQVADMEIQELTLLLVWKRTKEYFESRPLLHSMSKTHQLCKSVGVKSLLLDDQK